MRYALKFTETTRSWFLHSATGHIKAWDTRAEAEEYVERRFAGPYARGVVTVEEVIGREDGE